MRYSLFLVLQLIAILVIASSGLAKPGAPISSLAALVDGLVEVASSRELPWTTLSARHLDDGSFDVSLSAPARLYEFAPFITLASGSTRLSRDGDARVCVLSVHGAPPPAPPSREEALLRALEVFDSLPRGRGSIFYTWIRRNRGNLDMHVTLPSADISRHYQYGAVASWAPLQTMRVNREPTAVTTEMRALVVVEESSPPKREPALPSSWVIEDDPTASMLRLTTPPMPRNLLVENVYRFLSKKGTDLRALAISIDEDKASFTASWLRPVLDSSRGQRP